MHPQFITHFARRSKAYYLWLAVLLGGVVIGLFSHAEKPTQRVIVHFVPDSTMAERAAWLRQHDVVLSLEALAAVVIRTPQAPEALTHDPLLWWAEFDAPIALLQDGVAPADAIAHEGQPAPPPDPLYAQQWNVQAVAAPDAWMRLSRHHNVKVALIDSGICHDHPEFADTLLTGYDFVDGDALAQDEHGHGCGVAGIVGAARQNHTGIAGLLNGADLMALRVADGAGRGYASAVAAALVYAADHDADVINISLGTSADTHILRRAVAYAAHIPIIAATSLDDTPYFPAAYPDVMAVGSHDQHGQVISHGAADHHAPGVDILTTGLHGSIVRMSGTSAASAHLAGLVALQTLLGDEMALRADPLSQLVAATAPAHPAGARQIKVFVIVYQSSTPLYDPLRLNALTLADMTRSTIAHGYERPDGQPAIAYVLAREPVVVMGDPPPPDPNYAADYNYAAIYDDFDLCARIQQHEVDEVWIWGEANPAFGSGLEWVTNGPQLQWTWGSNVPDCGRTITTMWFEYNREVALALHSYGHRMEGAFMMRTPCQFMTATYPWAGRQWLEDQGRAQECLGSLSNRTGFVARAHANNDHLSACGDVHSPPNVLPGTGPYQYAEPQAVASICEDWQRDGSATPKTFGCERWHCNERDYHIWWKQNIPGIGYAHRDTDGTLLPNWYAYLYDMAE